MAPSEEVPLPTSTQGKVHFNTKATDFDYVYLYREIKWQG
jgi:hypothetical protein